MREQMVSKIRRKAAKHFTYYEVDDYITANALPHWQLPTVSLERLFVTLLPLCVRAVGGHWPGMAAS